MNPYQSSENSGELTGPVTPRRWWWPILAGVAFAPVAIFLAVLSHGFGHGDGAGDEMLFPLHRPLGLALSSEIAAEYMIYFLQYPLYGVVLGFANRRRHLLAAAAGLLGFHIVCYFARYQIADILIHVGF